MIFDTSGERCSTDLWEDIEEYGTLEKQPGMEGNADDNVYCAESD